MNFVYGFSKGNVHADVEEYQRRFPDRRIPSTGVFTRIIQTLGDTGSLPIVAMRSEMGVVRTNNTRKNILEIFQRNPRFSARRMTSRFGVSRKPVWRILHECDLHPYHYQSVQHLEPGDHAQRMYLCRWITAHSEI